MFTRVYLCSLVLIYVYHCLLVLVYLFTHFYSFLPMFCQCLLIYTYVHWCYLCLPVYLCLPISFRDCLPVFTPLYLRLYLFTYVYPCSTTVLEVGKPQRRSMEALIFNGNITKTLCPSDECDKLSHQFV